MEGIPDKYTDIEPETSPPLEHTPNTNVLWMEDVIHNVNKNTLQN